MGLIDEVKLEWTAANVQKFCVDIDMVGILILTAEWHCSSCHSACGPTKEGNGKRQWPYVQKFFAPFTFILWEPLLDRTVFLTGFMFLFIKIKPYGEDDWL